MRKIIRILLIMFTIMFLTSYFSKDKENIKNSVSDKNYNIIANIKKGYNHIINKEIFFTNKDEDINSQYKENKYIAFINNGINDTKKGKQQNNKDKIKTTKTEENQLEEIKILSNNISKTINELDKDIESTHRPLYTPDSVRQGIKDEIYKKLDERDMKSVNHKISASYYILTQVIDNDKYKELANKKNPLWNSYKENNLYSAIDYLKESVNITQNTSLNNDLKRVYGLCVYGVKNKDVIALIDAKRIIGDIECHILNLSSNNWFFELLNRNYKEEPELYYGASELLEGENYHLIGEYMYSLGDKDKADL